MATHHGHNKLAAIWRKYRFAIWSMAYAALIVYGSLYPFSAWQWPHHFPFLLLLQPWPSYITRTDILTNILAYLPLGYLLFKATRGMLVIPVLYATLLSFMMEVLQAFVPGRISSSLDILTNATGAACGALLGWWIAQRIWPCIPLRAWREKWFLPGRAAQSGLLLLGLWALSQLSLQMPSFIGGNLYSSFSPFWETLQHLERFKMMEALIYFLEISGLVLFTATLLRFEARRGMFVPVLFVTALLFKFLAAALLIKFSILPRLISLEALVGLGAGLALLHFLQRYGSRPAYASTIFMLASFTIAKAAYWFADMATGKLFLGGMLAPERLFNVTGFAYLISEIWPFLAMLYLLSGYAALSAAMRLSQAQRQPVQRGEHAQA